MFAYFLSDGQSRQGPIALEDLRAHELSLNTWVWREGLVNWIRAGELPELVALLAEPAPPHIPPNLPKNPPQTPSPHPPVPVLTMPSMLGDSGNDWLLMNPRLPKMARLITLYALIISPLIWLFNCSTIFATFNPADQSQNNCVGLCLDVLGSLVTMGIAVLLLIGGWRLRTMRRGSVGLCLAATVANLATVVLMILLVISLSFVVRDETAPNPNNSPLLVVLSFVIFAGTCAFDVVTLVWLLRNRLRLRTLFEQEKQPTLRTSGGVV